MMVMLNRDKIRRVVVSLDWGFTNPGALQAWAVDGDGRMYLISETYHAGKLMEWWIERGRTVYTAYRPEVFVCDPSEPAFIQQFVNAGLPAIAAFNSISLGIQAVQARLKPAADGKPRLFLSSEALIERDEDMAALLKPVCLQQEMLSYTWPKGVDGRVVKEIPVDIDNHAQDAMRYAVAYVDRLADEKGKAPPAYTGGRILVGGGRKR